MNAPPVDGPAPRPLAAGEGGRLPMGLSLFRFFLFGGLMLGAAYGGLSLYLGSPPPPGYTPPNGIPAAEWQPSLAWFPAWVAIRAGVGVQPSPSGYLYQGRSGYALYGASAIFAGMLLGFGLGWLIGERARRYVIRRREHYLEDRYGTKVEIRE